MGVQVQQGGGSNLHLCHFCVVSTVPRRFGPQSQLCWNLLEFCQVSRVSRVARGAAGGHMTKTGMRLVEVHAVPCGCVRCCTASHLTQNGVPRLQLFRQLLEASAEGGSAEAPESSRRSRGALTGQESGLVPLPRGVFENHTFVAISYLRPPRGTASGVPLRAPTARTLASRSPVVAPSSTLRRSKWRPPARLQAPGPRSQTPENPAHHSPRHRCQRARAISLALVMETFPQPPPTHATEFVAAPPRPAGASASLKRITSTRSTTRIQSTILLPETISSRQVPIPVHGAVHGVALHRDHDIAARLIEQQHGCHWWARENACIHVAIWSRATP